MHRIVRSLLKKTNAGRKLLNHLKIKEFAFQSASREPFAFLDKVGRKNTIDRVYEETFNNIFILLSALRLQGDIFEFGVFQGYTARLFARYMQKFCLEDTSLHLFDSFEGLPEEKEMDKNSYEYSSGVWKKGSLSVCKGMEDYIQKKLSKILSEKRVHVVKGFFEDTFESYFNKPMKAKLIHIDCDLYSASKYVLDFLFSHEIIQDGTLVIFDDWMTSLGNPNLGQRKATFEVLSKYPHWSLEQYSNYGGGSHLFIAHDLRITDTRKI